MWHFYARSLFIPVVWWFYLKSALRINHITFVSDNDIGTFNRLHVICSATQIYGYLATRCNRLFYMHVELFCWFGLMFTPVFWTMVCKFWCMFCFPFMICKSSYLSQITDNSGLALRRAVGNEVLDCYIKMASKYERHPDVINYMKHLITLITFAIFFTMVSIVYSSTPICTNFPMNVN